MGVAKAVDVEEILHRGSIRDADVYNLSQAAERKVRLSPSDAETLLTLNRRCRVQSPSWSGFFVTTLVDHVVNHLEPAGYVNTEKSDWLCKVISREGRVETRPELELLVAIISEARWVPASLAAFAIAQVREAVICGAGPLRSSGPTARGLISEGEIDLVRSLLCAFSRDDRIAVTRVEAEILFDINDEISAEGVPLAWTDLFVKALVNVVMAAGGYGVPPREQALGASQFKRRTGARRAVSVDVAVEASLASVRDVYTEQSSEERSLARLERQRIEIVTNEQIFTGDASWLAVRLLGGSDLTAAEEALLSYLRREDLIDGPLLGMEGRRSGEAA